MATFGAIASPFASPNVLFDAAKVDQQVQGFQRNRLLMQNAEQDQQQQTYQRDTQARIGMARELVNLPEAQAAAEWGNYRSRLQAAGFGQGLPEQFPGMERIKAVAGSDLTTFERLKIEEQRRSTEGLQSMFGITPPASAGGVGGAGAGVGYSPVSMSAPMPVAGAAPVSSTGNVRADNADAAARRQWAMDNLSGTDLEAELAAISQGRVTSLTGRGPGTQYRAPDGVNGVYAGVPAARPGVPVLASGQAPTMPASAGGGQAPAGPAAGGGASPAMPQLIQGGPMAGLTQDQAQTFRALASMPGANAAAILGQVQTTRTSNLAQIRQQMAEERQRRLDAQREEREERRDKRAEARDARNEPTGPIRGDGLNNSLMNILLTGDPASPEYAAAFARLGAEEVNPATGAVRRPDMSPYRAPTYLPPGSAPAPSGVGAPPGALGTTATAAAPGSSVAPGAVPGGGAVPFAASPQNPLAPQAVGGRNYGRADYTPSTQASPQAREAVRKAEVEVGRITSAIDRFEEVFTAQGGGSVAAVLNNPASPEAQRLLGAYEAMKATLRSEAFLNTGVLQPAEAKMLDDMLLSPQSIRGLMATPDAMKARLAEFRSLINRGLTQQRASAGIAPEASVPGPGGQGTASPPQPGAPRRLTFNPATGRIE